MSRFVVGTNHRNKLLFDVVISNKLRDPFSKTEYNERLHGFFLSISVFCSGRRILNLTNIAHVRFGEQFKCAENEILGELDKEKEYSVLFECTFPSGKFLPQESQVTYRSNSGTFATVVYDHFPPAKTRIEQSAPVVLIAHKIWLSKSMTSMLMISSVNELLCGEEVDEPEFVVKLFTPAGQLLEERIVKVYNGSITLNVKSDFNVNHDFEESPELFLLTAKGGGMGSYVLNTLLRDERSHTMAIEHSLYPGYYCSGNPAKVRLGALEGLDANKQH